MLFPYICSLRIENPYSILDLVSNDANYKSRVCVCLSHVFLNSLKYIQLCELAVKREMKFFHREIIWPYHMFIE